MYELIILSLLVRFPAHGYLIASIINDMIGPYARVSNGRLYPLLAKLEESGLIEVDGEGDARQHGERNSRSYRITEDGRQRFHSLMMDTTSNLGEYQQLFRYKVPVLYLLLPFEQIYLIEHYLNYCQAHVLHLIHEAEDMDKGHYTAYEHGSVSLTATLNVMKHVADQWRMEVEWVLRLRAEVLAQRESNKPQEERPPGATLSSRASRQRMQNQNQNQNQHNNQNQNQNQNQNNNKNCQ